MRGIALHSSTACFLLFLGSSLAAAMPAPDLGQSLRRDLRTRRSGSFETLVHSWQDRYGARAFSPLVEIARDVHQEDTDRYVAIMAAAKLGGNETAAIFVPFLRDRAWMVRNAALRALSALQDSRTAIAVLPLLKDPALVVRAEAVDAVARLQPPGAVDALVSALRDPANYHAQKAQWVPQRALAALRQLHAREAAPRIVPLLEHREDPELQRLTSETLASLTGRQVARNLSPELQAKRWREILSTR